jgi:hypothetical protein
MNRILLLSALSLVAAGFVAPVATAQAGDTCVEYAYVADYNWYYLCASTKGDCAVYQKHVSGVSESRTCLVSTVIAQQGPVTSCTPMTGDMDHQFSFCATTGNLKCPVYEKFGNGGVKCYP